MMYFKDALNLFNKELRNMNEKELSGGYSLEELKHTFWKLAKKYHSDSYPKATEEEKTKLDEKFKEINNAYEVLEKRVKNNNNGNFYSNYNNTENLANIKKEYIQKMESFNNSILNDDTRKAHNDIVIETAISGERIEKATSKIEIENIYKAFLSKLKVIYNIFKKKYFNENLIEEKDVYDSFNYDCNLERFYDQLKVIRQKYSPLAKIEQAALVYETWAGYKALESLIKTGIKNAKIKITSERQNLNKIIEEMHAEIKGIFDLYYKIKNRIDSLKKATSSIPIINDLEKIEQDFSKGCYFSEIERRLTKLEQKIMWQTKLEVQQIKMHEIYANVISKANSKLAIADTKDGLEFTYINDCLIKLTNIFKLTRNNLIDIEILNKLNDLTFQNIEIDKAIFTLIETVLKNSNNFKEEEQNILFVKKENFKYFNEDNFIFMIIGKKEGKYEVARYQSIFEITYDIVTKEELERDFEPLDKYLNKGYLKWTTKTLWDINEYYLYQFGIRGTGIIYLSEDITEKTMQIKIDKFAPKHLLATNPITRTDINKWQNPEYLKEQLIIQIKKAIEQQEQKDNTRKR